ncbi:MAG: NAD(P)-dependent oxidoreductase [Chitinispirillales bacterium]|jgi:nucleoside-diphosphate-sugar epimerase|nr:NAD(P)-dependent oxidoreductase [Chitinispirillales bacterium]
MKSIAITGATSMIGAALARRAVKEGIQVLCVVRKDSARLDNLPKSDLMKIEYCNVNEYSHLTADMRCDVFYHLAWDKTSVTTRGDVGTQAMNIQYTLDAVHLANRLGCRKFIGAGSQAEYGLVAEPLKSGTPANPQSGYGVAKYAAGKLSRLLCAELNMQFNWMRILSIFGPLDGPHTLIMYTINELRAGRQPELTKCEQIWDYLYCDDAAKALLAVGEKGIDGKTYPLGSGNGRKLSEYLESIKNIAAPDITLQFGKKEYYPHQPMYLCADISELTADTGWKPELSFEEGIKKIAAGL